MSARAKAKWGIIFLMYEVYNQKSIYTSSRMIVLTLCIKNIIIIIKYLRSHSIHVFARSSSPMEANQ